MRAERNFETFRGYRRSCEMEVEHDFYKYCKERYERKEGRKEGRKGKEGEREDGFGPSRSGDGVKWRDFSILRVFSCIIKMQRYGRVIDAMNIPLT